MFDASVGVIVCTVDYPKHLRLLLIKNPNNIVSNVIFR